MWGVDWRQARHKAETSSQATAMLRESDEGTSHGRDGGNGLER